MAILQQSFYQGTEPLGDRPRWVAELAHSRDACRSCAVCFGNPSDDDSKWFLFMYAMLSPMCVSLLPLERSDPFELPDFGDDAILMLVTSQWHTWNFRVPDMAGARHDYDLLEFADADVWILPMVLQDGCFVLASTDPMLLPTFVDNVGVSVGHQAGKRSERECVSVAPIMAGEHPWVKAHLMRKTGEGSSAPKAELPRSLHLDLARELDDDSLAAVFAEVDAIRSAWQSSHGTAEEALQHFRVEHRGGAWTAKHKAVPIDCCRGIAASPAGRMFLDSRGLAASFSCSFRRYTRPLAELLCHAWCRRMAHFLFLWMEADLAQDFAFCDRVIAAYAEPVELLEASVEWESRSAPSSRLAELRSIVPKGYIGITRELSGAMGGGGGDDVA